MGSLNTDQIDNLYAVLYNILYNYLLLSIRPLLVGLVTFFFDSIKPDLVGCCLNLERFLEFCLPFLGNTTPDLDGFGVFFAKSFLEGGFCGAK